MITSIDYGEVRYFRMARTPLGRAPWDAGAYAASVRLQVGERASRTVRITDEHIELFARLTGDRNPIHHDEEFARRSRFGGRIAQGGVVTGILDALAANELPGCVLLEQTLRYLAPVRPGESITGEVEVLAVRECRPIARLGVRVTREDGTRAVEGEATVLMESPAPPDAGTHGRSGASRSDPPSTGAR
ncbi:MAG: MaoC family dehydratase, partial [Chloroflexota bacterium]